jgi:hypothetical protein
VRLLSERIPDVPVNDFDANCLYHICVRFAVSFVSWRPCVIRYLGFILKFIIIIFVTFIQRFYNYGPETNHLYTVYTVLQLFCIYSLRYM